MSFRSIDAIGMTETPGHATGGAAMIMIVLSGVGGTVAGMEDGGGSFQ